MERESLREKFNQIDNENHVKSSSRITIWTLSKYAAILLICFIPFYFYFKEESSSKHIALKEKNTQKKKIFTDSTKIQTIDFDLKIDSYFSQSLSVISESSQGFGKKTQTTKLLFHVLNDEKAIEVIHRLNKMKPLTKKIRGTIDSLNQIINHYRNTYVFDIQQCELYINQRFESVNITDFEVLNIQLDEQKKYFLKVKEVYFELQVTKKPLQLEKLNNEEVKSKLDVLY